MGQARWTPAVRGTREPQRFMGKTKDCSRTRSGVDRPERNQVAGRPAVSGSPARTMVEIAAPDRDLRRQQSLCSTRMTSRSLHASTNSVLADARPAAAARAAASHSRAHRDRRCSGDGGTSAAIRAWRWRLTDLPIWGARTSFGPRETNAACLRPRVEQRDHTERRSIVLGPIDGPQCRGWRQTCSGGGDQSILQLLAEADGRPFPRRREAARLRGRGPVSASVAAERKACSAKTFRVECKDKMREPASAGSPDEARDANVTVRRVRSGENFTFDGSPVSWPPGVPHVGRGRRAPRGTFSSRATRSSRFWHDITREAVGRACPAKAGERRRQAGGRPTRSGCDCGGGRGADRGERRVGDEVAI